MKSKQNQCMAHSLLYFQTLRFNNRCICCFNMFLLNNSWWRRKQYKKRVLDKIIRKKNIKCTCVGVMLLFLARKINHLRCEAISIAEIIHQINDSIRWERKMKIEEEKKKTIPFINLFTFINFFFFNLFFPCIFFIHFFVSYCKWFNCWLKLKWFQKFSVFYLIREHM